MIWVGDGYDYNDTSWSTTAQQTERIAVQAIAAGREKEVGRCLDDFAKAHLCPRRQQKS